MFWQFSQPADSFDEPLQDVFQTNLQDHNDLACTFDPTNQTSLFTPIFSNAAISFENQGAVLPQSMPPTNVRRRDYTIAEKETFEQWITTNRNPNSTQRVQYAQENALLKSQVDSLINNRRRNLRRLEKEAENTKRNTESVTHPTSNSAFHQSGNSSVQKPQTITSEVWAEDLLDRKSSFVSLFVV